MNSREARQFEAEWRRRFERYARSHEDEALISGWSQAGLDRRRALFASLLGSLRLPPAAIVLDLGCGAGTYVRMLADLDHRPVGLDYSLPTLRRAFAADRSGKVAYLAGEAAALPFHDGTFDLVVSIGVLQALGQPGHAIAEMARVLRPGGVVVVEALNARAAAAVARRGWDTLRRRPVRVRAYTSPVVRGWLAAAGLALERREALLVPPPALPGLARVLDAAGIRPVVRAVPLVAVLTAHSFLYVARRAPTTDHRRAGRAAAGLR